jgi:hypothetical protein
MAFTTASMVFCIRALNPSFASNRVVRLLTEWKTTDIPVHAYDPMGPATRAAARALVDHLAMQFHPKAIHVRHA